MAPVLAFGFILLTTIKGDFDDLAGGFPAVLHWRFATCSLSFDIGMRIKPAAPPLLWRGVE